MFEDRRDDLQLAAAVRAMRLVDLEHPLEQLGPAQPHWAVIGARRLALDWRCGLRGWFGLLRLYLRAQFGVGCQNAMEANQVQSGAWNQRSQPLHELQRRQARGAWSRRAKRS